jgi:hypothetical protein
VFNLSNISHSKDILQPRTLSDTDARPNRVSAYLDTKNLNNNEIEGLCAGGAAYQSYCTQRKFIDLPNDRASYIGTGHTELTGCTVLTVVSARAVYMGSFN